MDRDCDVQRTFNGSWSMRTVALTFHSGMGTFCYFPDNPVLPEAAPVVAHESRATGRLGTHLRRTQRPGF
jgi:hypothetical protein